MSVWSVAARIGAELGEGLHWDPSRQRLWMVDIIGKRLLAVAPGKADHWERLLPQRVGWVLTEQDSSALLLGLQEGIGRLQDPEASEVSWLSRMFAGNPSLRLNDGKADSSGAIWAGSLNHDDETRPDGALYRVDPRTGSTSLVDSGYLVANGPAIDKEGGLMLHSDSGRRVIYSFNLNVSTGVISGKRIWKQFLAEEGYPDGMCFDADGCVWVAHWGAGCVSRFGPHGELLRRVNLPVSNVTNVCFGGPALDRLFVTSAKVGLTRQQLESQPLAGALFEIDCGGVHGLPSLAAGR